MAYSLLASTYSATGAYCRVWNAPPSGVPTTETPHVPGNKFADTARLERAGLILTVTQGTHRIHGTSSPHVSNNGGGVAGIVCEQDFNHRQTLHKASTYIACVAFLWTSGGFSRFLPTCRTPPCIHLSISLRLSVRLIRPAKPQPQRAECYC